MKEHFSSRVTKLLVILALAIVASVMFVIVGCDGGEKEPAHTTHTWVADTTRTDVAASCTTTGVHYVICSECGMTSTEETPALGHQWASEGALLRKEPTCTEEGYYYRECTREGCNYVETSSVIPATGHHLEYSADTAKITVPTCTTDGTITGTCKDCGEQFTYTGSEIQKLIPANGSIEDVISGIPADVLNKKEYNLANKGQTAKFLVAPGHEYHYGNEAECVVVEIKNDQAKTQLWNKCDRCEEEFEAVAHTVPAGFAPCKVATDKDGKTLTVPATYKGLTDEAQNKVAYAAKGEAYAYQCPECENYLKEGDHTYQISKLVSGNPVLDPENAVFEVAEGVTTLDCHYYYVCEYCNDIEVATPHTYPVSTDTANYKNCAHGDLCTVCGIALSQPTAHNDDGVMDRTHKDATFNGLTFAEPTCTTDGVAYYFCTSCAAREAAGEKINWVLGEDVNNPKANENYWFIDSYSKLNHGNWAGNPVSEGAETGFYVKTVSRVGDDAAVDCVTGTYERDICNLCGATRISVKPTFYVEGTGANKYVEVKKAEDMQGKTIYVLEEGKYVEVTNTNVSWTTDEYGRDWTDDKGNYGGTEPGEHKWQLMALKDYSAAELKEIRYPTCDNETAKMLYKCENCDTQTWRTVDIAEYAEDINTTEEALIKEYKEANQWHVGTMNACGHDYCSACTVGNHEAQYYFVFNSADSTMTIDRLAYFSCRTDAENLKNMNDYIASILKKFETEGVNEVKFYKTFANNTYSDEITDWSTIVKGNDGKGQIFKNVTIYVTRTVLEVSDPDQQWFNIENVSWSDKDNDLEIGWHLNKTVVANSKISSITVTLKNASGDVCVKAVTSGTQLSAYLKECEPYWADVEGDVLKYSIDGFCTATGATTSWTYTNTEGSVPAKGADLTGYTVEVSIVVSGEDDALVVSKAL